MSSQTKTCEYCNGKGSLNIGYAADGEWIRQTCSVCDGSGQVEIEDESEDD